MAYVVLASLKGTSDASGECTTSRMWSRSKKQAFRGVFFWWKSSFYPPSRKRGLPGFPAVALASIADCRFRLCPCRHWFFSIGCPGTHTDSKPCIIRHECSCSFALCRLVISNPAISHFSPPVPFPLFFPTIYRSLGPTLKRCVETNWTLSFSFSFLTLTPSSSYHGSSFRRSER